MSQGLVLPETIRAGRLGVKGGGKDLGDISAEAGVLMLFFLVFLVLTGPLAAGDGRIEGGGRVIRTQVFAGDGDAGLVIDEDLVMRVSALRKHQFLLAEGEVCNFNAFVCEGFFRKYSVGDKSFIATKPECHTRTHQRYFPVHRRRKIPAFSNILPRSC
jgi:hypothetical protein